MCNVILLSHGKLATGMKNTIELITGKQDCLFAYNAYVDGNDGIADFLTNILDKKQGEENIVITDFLGGSVNNDAMTFMEKYKFKLITGMNAALVLNIILKQTIKDTDINDIISESISTSQKSTLYLARKSKSCFQEEDF